MGGETSTLTHPLDSDHHTLQPATAARTLVSQPEPTACEADNLHASPNGAYLIQQYNCHDNLIAQLISTTTATSTPTSISRSYFLDWSPDGRWFLLRDVDQLEANQLLLVAADGSARQSLTLPFGTYGATFTPDGTALVYTASRGLGFGSEIGRYDLATGALTQQRTFPQQTVAYPRWSPDGQQMAYILMPDSNIPFTVGDLWLADATGKPVTRLDEVDAGHGYPPVWSPDGQTIAYVKRENPNSQQANHDAAALHSNLYHISPTTQRITQLTHFAESLVYDIAWAPDGRLAFTANDAVWVVEPGQTPLRVTTAGIGRHPVWLVAPSP